MLRIWRRRRPLWIVGYSLMALAGVASIAFPAPAVRAATSATSGMLVYVWAATLAVAGLSSAVGRAADRWLGEYAGLPALAVVFAVYSLAAAATGRPVAIAGASLFGSIAVLLLARWHDVALIRREAARFNAEHHRGS